MELNYETTFIYENGYLIREENAYPDLNNNLVVKTIKFTLTNTDQTVQYYYGNITTGRMILGLFGSDRNFHTTPI
jgi:hypothetical protein